MTSLLPSFRNDCVLTGELELPRNPDGLVAAVLEKLDVSFGTHHRGLRGICLSIGHTTSVVHQEEVQDGELVESPNIVGLALFPIFAQAAISVSEAGRRPLPRFRR